MALDNTMSDYDSRLAASLARSQPGALHGPIDELAGKTIARVLAGEVAYNNPDCCCALRFEFTDGTSYDVESSYTHSVTYVERVHE